MDLKSYLSSFGFLSSEDIAMAEIAGSERTLQKNELFIREGEICREVAFVVSGSFRSAYTNQSGEEITYCFMFPGNFITAYSSFITGNKSTESIYALTDSKIISISASALKKLEQTNMNWLRLSKTFAEQEYIKMEERLFSLLKETAETRYRRLLTNHSDLLHKVPLNHLSSYLGITQRHLSRIRRLVMN